MSVLMIDNYDSFTFNIVQYLGELGAEVVTVRNDEVDLADLERSLSVLPMGQSGHPASPHYDDMLPLWLHGAYHPFLMDRDRIERESEAHLVIEP